MDDDERRRGFIKGNPYAPFEDKFLIRPRKKNIHSPGNSNDPSNTSQRRSRRISSIYGLNADAKKRIS